MINDVKGHRITDQIKALRKQLAQDMGFVMPSVRILDNMQLGANEYRIRVKEVDSGAAICSPAITSSWIRRVCRSICRHAHDGAGVRTTGNMGERQSARGSVVPRPHCCRSGHRADHSSDRNPQIAHGGIALLCGDQKLLDDLPPENKKLVDELIPAQIPVTGVQRVLQTLLGERSSIRDLPAILEGIAEAVGHTKNALYITEHVRGRLARQLCNANLAPGGYLPLIAMSPNWEQAFLESIIGQGEDRQLAMAPSQLQQFIQIVRDRFDDANNKGELPVLLTSPQIRPFVRSIVERFRPATVGDVAERNSSVGASAHVGPGLSPSGKLAARQRPSIRHASSRVPSSRSSAPQGGRSGCCSTAATR
ncbi:MAG: FHIPEP family type III secretion protein [Rhizomicrobium sp.]